MHDDHSIDIDKHVRTYLLVFLALITLTVVTVAVYYLPLGVFASVVLALFIASIKAGLVACYFMHMISEKKLIYWVMGVTMAFFVVLLALPILTSLVDQAGT
jgi:cytochrome c oxidase subunit 4